MIPKFLEMGEVKAWLRLENEYTDEDQIINLLMVNAENYLKRSITDFEIKLADGDFKASAILVANMLIVDWYENRDFGGGLNEKLRHSIRSILLQMELSSGVVL